jgi:AcrR family transcriptional regulator
MARAKSPKTKNNSDDPLEMAVQLIANEGWESFRLSELAKRAGVPLSEIYSSFPDRVDVLVRFLTRLHSRAGAMPAVDTSSPARDRLFDSIMQVLDAAADEKPVFRVLVRDLPRDPGTLVALWPPIEQILSGIMDRAGMPVSGLFHPLRMLGLAGIVARVLGVWVDDGPEQAKTMATLDGDLRRIEPLLDRASPTRPPKAESGEESRDTLH